MTKRFCMDGLSVVGVSKFEQVKYVNIRNKMTYYNILIFNSVSSSSGKFELFFVGLDIYMYIY